MSNYKKQIISDPINDKILKMISRGNRDRLDFGLKKITRDHSHVVFTNETKFQNYKPEPNTKAKIIYSHKLFQYSDVIGIR